MSQEGGLPRSTLVCLMCYLDGEQDKNLPLNNLQAWKHVFVQEMRASQAMHGSKRRARDAKAGKQLGVVCIRCPRELRGDEPSCLSAPVHPSDGERPAWRPRWRQRGGWGDTGLRWLRYSRWMSMVTEVSFPLGMALLVARQTMLSPFSMSEGAMKRVLMMLSLLPSRRRVCKGRQGDGRRSFQQESGPFPWSRVTHTARPCCYEFASQSAVMAPPAGICQEPSGELHRHILLRFPGNWALNSHLLPSSPAVPRPESRSSGDMHVTPGLGKREPGDRHGNCPLQPAVTCCTYTRQVQKQPGLVGLQLPATLCRDV